jgi:hypothetical protein
MVRLFCRILFPPVYSFPRFRRAIEARVRIFIGQISMQDSDFEQSLPK